MFVDEIGNWVESGLLCLEIPDLYCTGENLSLGPDIIFLIEQK